MENKTSKYFKYAIGEILLVMIGILLALQVNNWNERKNGVVYEGKILKEIYRGLQSDSARITTWIKPRYQRKIEGGENLIEFIHHKTNPYDSIFKENFIKLNAGPYLTINFGPFEALKSNGLDKIKDDELRFWLVDIFESVFPRQLNFIESSNQRNKAFRENTYNDFLKPTTYQNQEGEIDISYGISKNILNDDRLILYIISESNIGYTLRHRSTIIQETISKTLQKLRNYFERNKIDYIQISQESTLGARSQLSDSTSVKYN